MGGEIVRGADVIRIEPCEERDAAGGAEHALVADVVLSSMPVKDLVAALPSAWFSDDVRKTAAALPYRDFMTAGLLVDRLLLKNETPHKTLGNIVPDCWIYIQEPDVRLGRLQVFNNWSPYLVRDPEHTVWLGLEYFCQEGDALWTMADDAFLRFATEELERIHVIAPGAVREGHVVRMQKAYPAYYGSYEAFPAVRAALDEIHGLYCIGRNGQHRYNNMDHSMLTALEAVRAIRRADETGGRGQVDALGRQHRGRLPRGETLMERMKHVAFTLSLFVGLVFIGAVINGDTWFLLNCGRYVEAYGVPHTEPFTMHEGLHYVMQQWLFALGLWKVYSFAGTAGLVAFAWIAGAVILFLFDRLVRLMAGGNRAAEFAIVVPIGCFLGKAYLCQRPQMVSTAVLLIECYLMERYKEGSVQPRWLYLAFPVLSAIVVNCHAALWPMTMIILLPYLAEAILGKRLASILPHDAFWSVRQVILLLVLTAVYARHPVPLRHLLLVDGAAQRSLCVAPMRQLPDFCARPRAELRAAARAAAAFCMHIVSHGTSCRRGQAPGGHRALYGLLDGRLSGILRIPLLHRSARRSLLFPLCI